MTTPPATNSDLRTLTTQFAQNGRLDAIYLRPARNVPCVQTTHAMAIAGQGLIGDRTLKTPSRNPLGSNRQVTLIQAEHIAVIAAFLNKSVDAAWLRRNLVVSGINLLAAKSLFKDQPMQLCIGEVVLEITGPCEPCSKMEAVLGKGAYNAMRGHGGVNAKVIVGGELKLGDSVQCKVGINNASLQTALF
ncbi:MAG: MOSC domain-containing protein [Methylotenera sp.]|nr:MAG: MOSC domain-containing protein [Methylotenera sp.]